MPEDINDEKIYTKYQLELLLQQYFMPGFRMTAAEDGYWFEVRDLLVKSLQYYGEPVPYWL